MLFPFLTFYQYQLHFYTYHYAKKINSLTVFILLITALHWLTCIDIATIFFSLTPAGKSTPHTSFVTQLCTATSRSPYSVKLTPDSRETEHEELTVVFISMESLQVDI